jgi:hydroxymethylglutaryl-CoA lyase
MKIIECPRDAMQGLEQFIETEKKVQYLNALLKVGFDTLDFGSFVSAKAIPQMRDTADLLPHLQRGGSPSKLLAIVANVRGAEAALAWPQIDYLGFPLSISETFQLRNTNKTIAEAFETVKQIQQHCLAAGRTLVTYISMGFGNPYGDLYGEEVVHTFVERLAELGVAVVSLADTIGVSQPNQITPLFQQLVSKYPAIEFGAHLHSHPAKAAEKIMAAYVGGCQRFDGALMGFGGCPMAEDELVGNVATEEIIRALEGVGENLTINKLYLGEALALSRSIFPKK